ncbi:MAG TPA: hypothetical protein PLR25_13335 [Planctomycetaceae bacterium]|nr:hypothetical protein [Planctomycetaceae bacterium]
MSFRFSQAPKSPTLARFQKLKKALWTISSGAVVARQRPLRVRWAMLNKRGKYRNQSASAATAAAESVEERKSPKGRVVELPSMYRTLRRILHHLEWHDGHDRYRCSATRSFDLTEEPYEGILHVRICAGGGWQQPSLRRAIL